MVSLNNISLMFTQDKSCYHFYSGLTSYVTILFVVLCFINYTGLKSLEYVYHHFTGLTFASIIFSYALALAVYLGSFRPGKLLALGGNTGNMIYDVSLLRQLIYVNLQDIILKSFSNIIVHDRQRIESSGGII